MTYIHIHILKKKHKEISTTFLLDFSIIETNIKVFSAILAYFYINISFDCLNFIYVY